MRNESTNNQESLKSELQLALKELRRWWIWLRGYAILFLNLAMGVAFAHRRPNSITRWMVITLLVAIGWASIALNNGKISSSALEPGVPAAQLRYVACTVRSILVSDEQKFSQEQRCYRFAISRSYTLSPLIFELPVQYLFDAGVLRHMLLIGFAIWLAFKFAAHYLEELYELPNTLCGEHYLLQSSLINPYHVLHIAEGYVRRREQDLPLYRIGGPGMVCVHLENASLFERMDGIPRVIGPTWREARQQTYVGGFERLRGIIDLRDQREKFNVSGRSQDGIRVTAEDVQVVYSVFRNHQEPTIERPYPFQDPLAIENLVYMQSTTDWNLAVAIQIRGELFDFYAKHPLNEFLAMIEEPELRSIEEHESNLQQVSQRLSGSSDDKSPHPGGGKVAGIDFVPRPDITNNFYRSAEERNTARGTQIDWVGVGTWKFPSQLILDRHRDAWRISHDNLIKSKPAVLSALKKQQRLAETLRLIQSVPVATFRTLTQNNSNSLDDVLFNLLLAYHQTMTDGYQDYLREIEVVDGEIDRERDVIKRTVLSQKRQRLSDEKERLAEVLSFLSRFTSHWI